MTGFLTVSVKMEMVKMIRDNMSIFIICWFGSGIVFLSVGIAFSQIIAVLIGFGFIGLTLIISFYYILTVPITKEVERITTRVTNIPAEEFNKYPRTCRHTDTMKDGIGLCVASISPACGYNLSLATTVFNGFPCCISCREYLTQKQRRTEVIITVKTHDGKDWGKEIGSGAIFREKKNDC